jgi:hypothetical protein
MEDVGEEIYISALFISGKSIYCKSRTKSLHASQPLSILSQTGRISWLFTLASFSFVTIAPQQPLQNTEHSGGMRRLQNGAHLDRSARAFAAHELDECRTSDNRIQGQGQGTL